MVDAECVIGSVNTFTIQLDPKGIVMLTWAPGTKIRVELAEKAMCEVRDLNAAGPAPLCMIMSQVEVSSRAARAALSRSGSTTRVAMVGESLTDQLHATSTLGVAPSLVPRRFFTSLAAARRWLLDS